MERYELFYKEVYLGRLTVNEAGLHRFEPEEEGIKAVKDRAPLMRELERGTEGFVSPIPFFQSRLRQMRRWGLNEINYQTDWFLLRKRPEE